MPKVSVLMSNYNTPEEYLRTAIESVLNQTFKDFEFIIFDDASTDNSASVIESYQDERIRFIRNKENLGLTKTLNNGLGICKGEYIARFDADDICYPERLEKQVRFMDSHPEYIVCGAHGRYFGEKSGVAGGPQMEWETHRVFMMFSNYPVVPHVLAMLRAEMLRQFSIDYDESYRYAQDYQLWVTCLKHAPIAILDDVLLDIRVREGTISTGKKAEQDECAFEIMQEQLDNIHLVLTDEIKPLHFAMLTNNKLYDLRIKEWMHRLLDANQQYNYYHQKTMKGLFDQCWVNKSYYALKHSQNKDERIYIIRNLSLKQKVLLLVSHVQKKQRKRKK